MMFLLNIISSALLLYFHHGVYGDVRSPGKVFLVVPLAFCHYEPNNDQKIWWLVKIKQGKTGRGAAGTRKYRKQRHLSGKYGTKTRHSLIMDFGRLWKHNKNFIDELRGLSLLPVDCGFIQADQIIGSKYARLHEFPWMALIFHFAEDGARQLKCSGTVVSQRYVLTAGHCVNNAKSLQVRVGDYDREQDVDCESQGEIKVCEDQFQEIDVEKTIVHEDYSMSFDISKDIALLRLKTPIDFSYKNAAPVCLPTIPELQNKSLTGKEAIIAGWELMVNGQTTSKMLKVNVPIRNDKECNEHVTIRKAKSADQNQICTGGVEGVCQMDVGSALMLPSDVKDNGFRYIQYGIAVNGTRVCDSKNWTAFTDVSKHMEWILNNLKA